MRPVRPPRTLLPVLASLALLFLATAAWPALGGSRASAQDVPHLASQVTDQTGVLEGQGDALQGALDDLLAAQDVQLFVAFITTSGDRTAPELAQETFGQNGLGGNDMLLLVAVDDRRYAWYENGAIPQLSSSSVDALLSTTLEPRFRAGDYAGGVTDFAQGLAQALGAGPAPAATPGPTVALGTAAPSSPAPAQGSSSGAAGTVLGVLLAFIVIAVGLTIAWAAWRRRRLIRLGEEERDRRTGQLARQANQLLITSDDAVRDLQQELGFAEAEFEATDVEPFRAALGQAKEELKAAFTVRQRLDDEIPEDPATRELMLNEILARCRRVDEIATQQRSGVAALRDIERRAPEILAALPSQVAALQARLPAAEATMERLAAYAEVSWRSVRGNVEEARKRIEFAAAEAARGSEALAASGPGPGSAGTASSSAAPAPDTHTARRAARAAQSALAEAATLLDGIDRLAASLDDARSRLDGELRAAEIDVKAARAALGSTHGGREGQDGTLAARVADAEAQLAAARAEAVSTTPDVLAAAKGAQTANATADQVLASVREAAELRARQQAALGAALQTAGVSVAHAADYVESRRQGVGREARTRLAEAQRHLEQAQALATTDPDGSLSEARLAAQMADEAYRVASSQFDDWDRRGGGGGRGSGDLTGAILGGIILGGILGGGRHGGGFGGTRWGMPGGGGGFGRGGGGGWSGGGGGGRGGGGGW